MLTRISPVLLAIALSIGTAVAQAPDLGANIMRRVNSITVELDKAEDALDRNRPAAFQGYIKGGEKEYATIFKYYPGKADPNHPILAGLKKRMDTLRARAASAGGAAAPKPAVGQQQAQSPGGDRKAARQAQARLYAAAERIKELRAGGDTSAKTYEEANSALVVAESAFKELTTTYKKHVDALGGGGFLGAKHAINTARENVKYVYDRNDVTRAAAAKAMDAKTSAAVKAIQNSFKQQGVTGKRHAANVGRFIWSKKEIGFKIQDTVTLSDAFKLSDPIYGRLYTARSIGNTPVYQEGSNEPARNRRLSYEFRLYIDGQNVPVKFGVFESGRYLEKLGQTFTTWQYAPNPVPPDDAFKRESDAWRAATKSLAEGRYGVRFELWGVNASYRTREPMAVGEFTLLVGAGERVAATGRFPADTYKGGDLKQIRAQMKQALVGPVTQSADKILEVSVTGDWVHGRDAATKNRYRKIRGAVLWADTDGDKVCRYHTYTFISDEAGGGWAPLRYRAFGSPEGEMECPGG